MDGYNFTTKVVGKAKDKRYFEPVDVGRVNKLATEGLYEAVMMVDVREMSCEINGTIFYFYGFCVLKFNTYFVSRFTEGLDDHLQEKM